MIVNNLNFNAAWKSALLNVFFYVFEGTIVLLLWIYSMPTFLSLYLSTRVPGALYYRQSIWYKYKVPGTKGADASKPTTAELVLVLPVVRSTRLPVLVPVV